MKRDLSSAEQSAFEAWFREQHGPRSLEDATDEELMERMKAGVAAHCELQRREKYDSRRTSALWAWQAKERT